MTLTGPHKLPHVTILTPTKDRLAFLDQCAKYVDRQTYPKDLIQWVIVNSGNEAIDTRQFPPRSPEGSPNFELVVIHQQGLCVGALRNAGLSRATGEIIVHFDDDDWHAPDRIERQVVPFLVRPSLDLVCTEDYHVILFDRQDAMGMHSWSWGLETFSSGGTFAYRKSLWKRRPFPNIQTGEDQIFARWARLERYDSARNLRDPGLLVVVRHGKNTCEFDEIVRERATHLGADWVRSLMGERDYAATEAICRSFTKSTLKV